MTREKEEEGLEASLIDSLSRRGETGVVMEESFELFLDSKFSDGFLKEIPIVKYIIATKNGILDVRDYLFVKKIVGFLNEVGESDQKLRDDFAHDLRVKRREKEVGTHLIELIDKSFGIEKVKTIGRTFVLFLENGSTCKYEDFVRISEMIVNAYESDLRYFFNRKEDEIGESGDEVEHLISLGFYERKKSGFGNSIFEDRKPTLTTFGRILKQVK